MKKYTEMTTEELLSLKNKLELEFEDVKGKGLKLDMSRGKPAADQLDLTNELLTNLTPADLILEDGTDIRNYGLLTGIMPARKLIAEMMEVSPSNVTIFGNSSLAIMFDTMSRYCLKGVLGGTPWSQQKGIKWLCPVPGYDRHFAITEHFGIEMITVPMLPTGPDMDVVEHLAAADPMIKGIWCVPKYANPTGISYSDETVRRFASMKTAAEDFRIFWDNAYCVHDLYEEEERQDKILNILEECEKAGNPDRCLEFCSTSKVTFPGAGIAALVASERNLEDNKSGMMYQIISHDKVNQMRHVKFLKNQGGIKAHMMKQAAIMRPKFEAVLEVLEQELGGLEIGSWTRPNGGYFISFDAMSGCAAAIIARAKQAGVVMTGAGATYPYHKDPDDSNIRIAPSYPTPEDLAAAASVFVLSVKICSVEKLLMDRKQS